MNEDYWVVFFKIGYDTLKVDLAGNTLLEAIQVIQSTSNELTVFKGCTITIMSRFADEDIEQWDEEKLIYIMLKYS